MLNIDTLVDPLTKENCYIVTDNDAALVIDPGSGKVLVDYLQEKKISPDTIILTHEHCDHMAGLGDVKRAFPKALVIASKACSRNLSDTKLNMSGRMNIYLLFLNKEAAVENYPKISYGPADIEIGENKELPWKDHWLKFSLLPGHTPGSMGIMLDDRHFFSGDYLIMETETITRFPGGDKEAYEAVTKPFLERIKGQTHIWPGHGKDYVWEGL